ncbi:MAG: hypothetical protein LC118_19625 [Dehalococcoidia bacterium]|nr:hypothetical protein [Dehalococcoidia bacterium]
MHQQRRPPKPAALQALVASGGLLLLFAAYFAIMAATVSISEVNSKADANYRDAVYLVVHLGLLTFAAVLGFVVGKWLNGLGLAYAMLFVIILALGMVFSQAGSYELACRGRNDVIRHWTC